MRYQRFVYVQDATEAVAGEVLGTGNGVKVTFSGSLAQDNIQPGTLTITAGAQTLTDDGAGNLTGDGSGTINYDTGDYSVTFNAAPASGVSVTADYDYHPTIDKTLSVPGHVWVRTSEGVGGIEWSAARVPSSYEIRRDQKLRQRLRFMESEWPDVRKLLEHGQRGTLITVYPDSTGVGRTCYLVSPGWDEGVQPTPTEFPGLLEIEVEWVDASGSGFDAFDFYGA